VDRRVNIVRNAITNPGTPWVLFSHGTLVFMPGQSERLEDAAKQLLADWGPVQTGTPSGDFRVIGFDGGFFVGCHHPDILTLVMPDDVSEDPSDPEVGLFGRGNRERDAKTLSVVYVQEALHPEALVPEEESEVEFSDNLALADAQRALLQGDLVPMTDYLLAGEHWISLEREGDGATVYRETKLPIYLPDPWAERYMEEVRHHYLTCNGPRGLEVRTRGPFYALTSKPIQELRVPILVTGIEHTGKMRGAAAQAILTEFGSEVESMAQIELAKTDRSLGTVVFTEPEPFERPQHRARPDRLGHVVSTPKRTAESPGWLKRAVASTLDQTAAYGVWHVGMVALGTNGGITSEECANLMIGECKRWFENHTAAMLVVFSLPDSGVRKAFEEEFRRRKLFFVDF
jgi:O-acetyl-ADP-ribose deacetylase (regulator of RNase III)